MLVHVRLDYIGPQGFLAEWKARRRSHASCKPSRYWSVAAGGYIKRAATHDMVVWIDEESSTCYCGGCSGQYMPSRDAGTMLFKKVAWFECASDIEAAEETRRAYEDEITKVQGGRWEWTTIDGTPEEQAMFRPLAVQVRVWRAPNKFTRQPGEEGPLTFVRPSNPMALAWDFAAPGFDKTIIERRDNLETGAISWTVRTPTNDGMDLIETVTLTREDAVRLADRTWGARPAQTWKPPTFPKQPVEQPKPVEQPVRQRAKREDGIV